MVKHKEPGLGLAHSLDVKAVDPALIQLLRSKLLALPRQQMLKEGPMSAAVHYDKCFGITHSGIVLTTLDIDTPSLDCFLPPGNTARGPRP